MRASLSRSDTASHSEDAERTAAFRRLAEQTLRFGRFGNILSTHRLSTSICNGLESFAFMHHITFCGLNEVWYQVVPTFELDINLRPGIGNLIAQSDKGIIQPNYKYNQQNNYYNYSK